MREYRRVPALESGSKLSNPDLQDIGEKNYTDIILRYGNLTTKFPQLDTNAKTIVAAINELYAHPGGSIVIPNPPIDGLETELGEALQTELGETISTEQGGGGSVVGDLTSISIDGDIYTISGGGSNVQVIQGWTSDPKVEVADIMVDGQSNKIYAPRIQVTSAVLLKQNWDPSTLTQSVNVSGINQSQTNVIVNPAVTDYDNYVATQIRAVELTTNMIKFACKTIPSTNITVNIAFWRNY